MKGYKINTTLKDKLQNEFNSEYGINLRRTKDTIDTIIKPRNIINDNIKIIKKS